MVRLVRSLSLFRLAPRLRYSCLNSTYKMASQTIVRHENNVGTQSVITAFQLNIADFPRSLLPQSAFDTHVHVFDPTLGPYATGRAYTPEDAPLNELIAFNRVLSTDPQNNNLVLVQPSPYKNDCTVMMKCLEDLKDKEINAFGIAVLDLDHTADSQLKEMHRRGVRGIRLNFQADGKDVSTYKLVTALQRTADRIRHLPGWMIQLFVPGWAWDSE